MIKTNKSTQTSYFELTDSIIEAGEAIMEVYRTPFNIIEKQDGTPVTAADFAANEILIKALKKTGLPIISEESDLPKYDERKNWKEYWIIDPLDGTLDFVRKGDDFTVNVARIKNNQPVEGYIYVPVTQEFYWGEYGKGAFKMDKNKKTSKLPIKYLSNRKIVASKSHYNKQTKEFINLLIKMYPNMELIHTGSSLKFCLVAEGKAILYPRIGAIKEWDIAAGHAILRAAGAYCINLSTGKCITYNTNSLKTPDYIAGLDIDMLSLVSNTYKKL